MPNLGQYKTDATVIRELKLLYKDKLLSIERASKFNKFHHPEILDAELAAKPTVLLVGRSTVHVACAGCLVSIWPVS